MTVPSHVLFQCFIGYTYGINWFLVYCCEFHLRRMRVRSDLGCHLAGVGLGHDLAVLHDEHVSA